MNARFQAYEEVKVSRAKSKNSLYADLVGVVVGFTHDPNEPRDYGLLVDGLDEMVVLSEEELEATGRQFKREDLYDDNAAIRVRIDEQGRGSIV